MKRVIITGGNGFIGKHLVNRLLDSNLCSIVIIANKPNKNDDIYPDSKLSIVPTSFYTADVRDGKTISKIIKNSGADTCVHLAAKISVPDSIRNPDETIDINANGTLSVLEACYNGHVNNFVLASSASVYGDVSELPIKENTALGPLSPYGKSKMLAEQHVLSYKQSNKLKNAISLRIFNVYGQCQSSQADVISKFAERISKRLPPIIYGDGNHTRDFISVDDVVDGILLSIKAMENKNNNDSDSQPAFNLGSGKATSVKELAHKMISISGLELNPIYEEGYQDGGVISKSYADMSNARRALHFVAKKNLETGLKEIIEPMLVRK